MLSVFPDLLAYGLIAPVLLRLALGVTFLRFGWGKLRGDKEKKASFFEALGLRPGKHYCLALALIELAVGILLVVGLYTQVAALVAAIISGVAYHLKAKHSAHMENSRSTFFLLTIIGISLLFLGAGFWAFDWPL